MAFMTSPSPMDGSSDERPDVLLELLSSSEVVPYLASLFSLTVFHHSSSPSESSQRYSGGISSFVQFSYQLRIVSAWSIAAWRNQGISSIRSAPRG